jgi:gliding motility-associated-like protein
MVYTYGDGCKIERSVNVTLRPGLDTVNIVADPDTTKIFSGESITLRAVVSPTQNLNGFQFTWLENQTTTVGSGETLTISRTTGETKSSFKYLITAQSPNGCKKTEEFTLTVCPDIVVIPNAFTPDGDGENETFGMSVLAGIVKAESFEVYNRWGELIFQSNDPNPRWDGTINGQPAPTDTYIYILQYRHGDGRLDPKQGAILLLR